MPPVPLDHDGLRAAMENGVFPDERHWIDFKRGLYPRRPGDPDSEPTKRERKDAHRELARDAASMAIRGGYLIYGVDEDRANFRFDPVGMALEPGVRETVNQAVSSQTSPPLSVVTHLLHRPDVRGMGFLVVEVDESPDAPHMVDGRFHGRSDTGRTTLDEPDVERLILQRRHQQERLREAMALTIEHDPGVARREDLPRMYLTAVPTRGYRDMFRPFTDPLSSRATVWKLCHTAAQRTTQPADRSDRDLAPTPHTRRGQRIDGVWYRTWDDTSIQDGWASHSLGISDDGQLRYQRFRAGLARAPRQETDMVFAAHGQRAGAVAGVLWDSDVLWYVHGVSRLIGVLAGEVSYTGSWLIGLEIHGLHRYVSERHHRSLDYYLGPEVQILDNDRYRQSTRASTSALQTDPLTVAATLMRPLLRNLGHETLIDEELAADSHGSGS